MNNTNTILEPITIRRKWLPQLKNTRSFQALRKCLQNSTNFKDFIALKPHFMTTQLS